MSRLSAAVLTLTGLFVAPLVASQARPTPPAVAPGPSAAAPLAPTQTPAVPARQSRPGQPPSPPTAAPTPKPAAAPAMAMAPDPAQQVNVRVELSISETSSGSAAAKKTVSLMTAGFRRGSVRSSMDVPGQTMRLNVDAMPMIMKDGRISLDLVFVYSPERTQQTQSIADLNEQMTVFVSEGKPILISQSADPKGDRKVTVEVTATIVK